MPGPDRAMLTSPLDTESLRHRVKIDTSPYQTSSGLPWPGGAGRALALLGSSLHAPGRPSPKPPVTCRLPKFGLHFCPTFPLPTQIGFREPENVIKDGAWKMGVVGVSKVLFT